MNQVISIVPWAAYDDFGRPWWSISVTAERGKFNLAWTTHGSGRWASTNDLTRIRRCSTRLLFLVEKQVRAAIGPGHKTPEAGHNSEKSGHGTAGTHPGTQPAACARAEAKALGPVVSRGDTTTGHRDTTAGTHRSSNPHGSGTALPSGPSSPCRSGHRFELSSSQFWITTMIALAGFWGVIAWRLVEAFR